MFHSNLEETYKLDHTFDENSPELRFLNHICTGGSDVDAFFYPKTANKRDVCVYTPESNYCGIEEIRRFSKNWLDRVGATSAEVHPVIQTIAGGRAVSEVEIWFQTGADEPMKIPMALFADLGPHGKLEGLRIYYFYQWIPGTPAYNKPIFRPTHNTPSESTLLTGVVRYYYEQLHNPYPPEATKNILGMASETAHYGGYRPIELRPIVSGLEKLREKYEGIISFVPRDQYIRFETITDDGRNCLVEWTSIIRKHALFSGAVSQAGMAAYERDGDGKLSCIRICDNLGFEQDIDYSTLVQNSGSQKLA